MVESPLPLFLEQPLRASLVKLDAENSNAGSLTKGRKMWSELTLSILLIISSPLQIQIAD